MTDSRDETSTFGEKQRFFIMTFYFKDFPDISILLKA